MLRKHRVLACRDHDRFHLELFQRLNPKPAQLSHDSGLERHKQTRDSRSVWTDRWNSPSGAWAWTWA